MMSIPTSVLSASGYRVSSQPTISRHPLNIGCKGTNKRAKSKRKSHFSFLFRAKVPSALAKAVCYAATLLQPKRKVCPFCNHVGY